MKYLFIDQRRAPRTARGSRRFRALIKARARQQKQAAMRRDAAEG